ncbi:MAG: glycine zipper 2TM domain-containing protein [Alphaproteobacteria bacterium]|nr:glycine zipper 2TM domain-containing protein [Alphaproteobacteria bacterium]
MNNKTLATLLMLAILPLTACNTLQSAGTKQTGGALIGAGLGGFAGSQIGSGTGRLAATAAGVLIGGLLGSEIGSSLDNADRAAATQANTAAYSAPIGKQIVWNNPDSGNSGTITPVREGRSSSGEYCREFQQTITVGGQKQQGYGTACRQPDGSWKVVQ